MQLTSLLPALILLKQFDFELFNDKYPRFSSRF
jgi:hypothetical protein